jgi:hypothetical protein
MCLIGSRPVIWQFSLPFSPLQCSRALTGTAQTSDTHSPRVVNSPATVAANKGQHGAKAFKKKTIRTVFMDSLLRVAL